MSSIQRTGASAQGPSTPLMQEHETDERIKKINKEGKFYIISPASVACPLLQCVIDPCSDNKDSTCNKIDRAWNEMSSYEHYQDKCTPNQYKLANASVSACSTYCVAAPMVTASAELGVLWANVSFPFCPLCLSMWAFTCFIPACMCCMFATRYLCCDPKTQ